MAAESYEVTVKPGVVVDALWLAPSDTRAVHVFAHGAGAPMTHAFMERVAADLFERGIATLRYQFPYMQAGSRRPDHRSKLEATVGAAVAHARQFAPALPLFAGGKSMGGRMTSQWLAREPGAVQGLIFHGFPLHPSGRPGTDRADHLKQVQCPMLALQGTRDKLAEWPLVESCFGALPTLRLARIEGADHGFAVLKRSGRTPDGVYTELADTVDAFVSELATPAAAR